MNKMLLCASLTCLFSAAGCGGGGGGGSAPAAVAATPPASTTTTTTTPDPTSDAVSTLTTPLTAAAAVTASGSNSFAALPSSTTVFPAGNTVGSATSSSLTLNTAANVAQVTYYSNGSFAIAATVNGTTYSDTFAANTETRVDANSVSYNQNLTGSSTLISTVALYSPNATASALQYTEFGVWTRDLSDGSATLGIPFAIGYETPAAGMPKTGSASYSGAALGTGVIGSQPYDFEGSVVVSANFGTSAVSANFTNMQALQVSGTAVTSTPWNSFSSSAQIGSGTNGFSGTTSAAANGSSLSPSALSGSISGKFFGPAAQEIGGVWTLSGGNTAVLGSFGGKQ